MTTKSCFVALALIASSAGAWAQSTVIVSQTDNVIIPDNDLSGISETVSLGSSIQSITGVQLTLDIGGTDNYQPFNGDFYAYLEHGSGMAVLLNRVGVTAGNSFGYADTGFDVTFSDSGPDIHNYQNGIYNLNAAGQLTGTWGPDGRTASPFTVLDTSPRTALLSSFDGGSAGGTWTLFIADTSPGGIGNLDGWSLQVTGNTNTLPQVPDSGNTLGLLAVGFSLLLLASCRRRPNA
jgi:subtilisin-like proprotein convertase family protein